MKIVLSRLLCLSFLLLPVLEAAASYAYVSRDDADVLSDWLCAHCVIFPQSPNTAAEFAVLLLSKRMESQAAHPVAIIT